MTTGTGRVMVVATHPDDPEFLAGGTVARLAKEGREIAYVIVTNGNKGSSDRGVTSAGTHSSGRAAASRSGTGRRAGGGSRIRGW
jgi:LmbE family N-acetylglucosaminyl deacetylase